MSWLPNYTAIMAVSIEEQNYCIHKVWFSCPTITGKQATAFCVSFFTENQREKLFSICQNGECQKGFMIKRKFGRTKCTGLTARSCLALFSLDLFLWGRLGWGRGGGGGGRGGNDRRPMIIKNYLRY